MAQTETAVTLFTRRRSDIVVMVVNQDEPLIRRRRLNDFWALSGRCHVVIFAYGPSNCPTEIVSRASQSSVVARRIDAVVATNIRFFLREVRHAVAT